MARKRFRNKTKLIQVVYDETGEKRELVPSGTVVLDEQWAQRFAGVLEPVVVAAAEGKRARKAEEE